MPVSYETGIIFVQCAQKNTIDNQGKMKYYIITKQQREVKK